MLSLKLNNNLGNLFNEWDKSFFNNDHTVWRRNVVNYEENDSNYEFFVPLAGFKKEDVELKVSDGAIFLDAKKEDNKASHSFLLPEDTEASSISSKMEDGLLSIKIDKLEKSKTFNVEIS